MSCKDVCQQALSKLFDHKDVQIMSKPTKRCAVEHMILKSETSRNLPSVTPPPARLQFGRGSRFRAVAAEPGIL